MRRTMIGKSKGSTPSSDGIAYYFKTSTSYALYDADFNKLSNITEINDSWSSPIVSPNGRYMTLILDASSSDFYVYDIVANAAYSLTMLNSKCARPAFSDDSQYLYITTTTTDQLTKLRIYDTNTFTLQNEITTPFYSFNTPQFSSGGQLHYLDSNRLLLAAGGNYVYNHSDNTYTSITASPAGNVLNADKSMWVYGMATSPYWRRVETTNWTNLTSLITATGSVQGVAFSPNGNYFASVQRLGSTRRLLFYSIVGSTWTRITTAPTLTTYAMYSVAFSADNQYLIILSNSATEGLLVYRITDWQKITISDNFAGISLHSQIGVF